MSNFDIIFQGARVPMWLQEFERAPYDAVEDLLVGRANMGLLSAEEPSMLLLDWLTGIGDQADFADDIDKALVWWINRSWGNPEIEKANKNASLTAVAWCRVADVIAMDERLVKSANCLRQWVTDDHRFLNDLCEGRTRDPMARVWLAIARHQKDRSLVGQWWHLCSIPPDEPWYRGEYGIHGLRGLPPATPLKKGIFTEEIAEGLAMLASALRQRQEQGWLQNNLAENEFLRTARMTMAAYPFPKEWQDFWEHAVNRNKNKAPWDWVKKIARLTDEKEVQTTGQSQIRERQTPTGKWTRPNPQWRDLRIHIAGELGRAHWDVLGNAEALLADQAKFSEITGDTYFVARTACNFAGKVRKQRPELALKWAELARDFEPWNVYGWSTSSKALLTLGRHDEALAIALHAVDRFPENAVVRTGLAELFKAQGRFPEAEAVYRETIDRFPEDLFARTGLAEVLKAQGRLAEAEAVYRKTLARHSDESSTMVGLAGVLFERNAWKYAKEIERLYRQALPTQKIHASHGLATLLKSQGRTEEAAELLVDIDKTTKDVPEAEPVEIEKPVVIGETADHAAPESETIKCADTVAKIGQRENVAKSFGKVDETDEATVVSSPINGVPQEQADMAVKSAADYAEASPGLNAEEIKIFLSDAYILRRWQSRTTQSEDQQTTGALRGRAQELINKLRPLINRNSRAASEAGLIRLTQGELEEAVQFLREASERFRGSVRVHYALARAQRELARVKSYALSAEAETDVIVPWQRLNRIDAHCRPVQLLGEGRAWLTLVDGATVEAHARTAFGQLGYWIGKQIKPSDREVDRNATPMERIRDRFAACKEADPFFGWWAREVHTYLFGEKPISRAEDLEDLTPLRQRIAQHSNTLDQIEEECVARFDRD